MFIQVRFMVDTNTVGCNWIELPASTYQVRDYSSSPSKISRCQLEVDIAYDKFISHKPEGRIRLCPCKFCTSKYFKDMV